MPNPPTNQEEIASDIRQIVRQESSVVLAAFSPEIAWQLGVSLREIAVARGLPLVIDVRRFGDPHQKLFYTALDGTTPDNARWVERKINVVARFHKSSYHVGRLLELSGLSFSERYNLPESDYATHGGSFPIRVKDAGIVGAVTVSGLPQREDHNLVMEALCLLTGQDHEALRLG